MSLGAWMDPGQWEARKFQFLAALANSRWVTRGEPANRQLVKELSWGGRMFGTFTTKEKIAVERWIEAMAKPVENRGNQSYYQDFVGMLPEAVEPSEPFHFSAIFGVCRRLR